MATDRCPVCRGATAPADLRCPACGVLLTTAAARARIGKVLLGRYRVDDVLGHGGMSVVYRGRDLERGQEVALKLLPPELAADPQIKHRFVEEARALASLDHPGIVQLHDFGQDHDCVVLVMQLVRGPTWERLILDRGGLGWQATAEIARDVLSALGYAHQRGVIHRDMKPSNVLVRAGEGAIVMDFGIAKMTSSARLTATGQTMGTVRYMSPEQVRADELDPRTDLYSLAVTMYESLTGETPFDGDSPFAIMSAHLAVAPPPIRERVPDCPPALEALVLRAMAKDPADRPADAATFLRELEAIGAVERPRSSSRAWTIAALVALAILAAVAAVAR